MKGFFSLLLVSLLAISCGSKSATNPSGSGSFSWNGPIILSVVESGIVETEIGTSTGPITNAAVTLTYAGSPAVLTYQASLSYPVTASGSVTLLSLAYYTNSSFTYVAGQPYTITAAFGGSTYSANTTVVGTPIFSTSGSNLVCTWAGGGNENVITAELTSSPYTVKTFGPSIASPYSIPNSSLPGGTGQNDVIAAISSLNTAAFSGTSNGSYLLSSSGASTVY